MKEKYKYQYSYFILPFVYNMEYEKYIEKLVKSKKVKTRIFEQVKDLEIYSFFKEEILKNIFYTIDKNEWASKTEQEKIMFLTKKDVAIFSYDFFKDEVKVKNEDSEINGINFNYEGAELFVFKTGIAIIVLKTVITDTKDLGDVLDFNCRFKTLISDESVIKKLDNIQLNMNEGYSIIKFKNLLKNFILENAKNDKKSINNFYTFSYLCVDNMVWNETTDEKEISKILYKYMRVFTSTYDTDALISENMITKILDELKYTKIAVSKVSSVLISSGVDPYNFTILPRRYETQMLYTYIIALYQKKYLEKLNTEIAMSDRHKKFKEFNNKFWYQEITLSEKGTNYYNSLKEVLETNELYNEVSSKYNIIYRYNELEKSYSKNIKLTILLIISIIINIILIIMKYWY